MLSPPWAGQRKGNAMARATIAGITNWQKHRPVGGGAFPGEVCVSINGLAIRDVLNRQGKGFKTEFNLETMSYQFYSVCNPNILKHVVQNRQKFLFPVSASRRCFGWITVKEYAEVPVPQYLHACGGCSDRSVPIERHVLKLDEAHLVAEDDAFPIYQAEAWERLGWEPPTRLGKLIRKAEIEQADALADYLASKMCRTADYLKATLALKHELLERYPSFLKGSDLSLEHILHLKGLVEETDYFDVL